jgi:histidyl-tRNA synthetase
MSKSIYKPRPISGFPEWLPEVRAVEQQWFDHIRKVFESYGFCSIETPSVEEIDVLTAKGEVDKEIYVIERLHKEENDKEARLALHFDQTVPFARYVAQHFNDLTFPFKRYQMQRVWRGERPQAGRFREFYQCDIDVINVDNLPIHFDAEMPAIMWEILSSLPGMEDEKFQIRISNRKILLGYCQGIGITENVAEVLRILDKLEKIGIERSFNLLRELGLLEGQAQMLIDMTSLKTSDPNKIRDFIYKIEGVSDDVFQGLEELETVLKSLTHLPQGSAIADLSIIRGLDYYTGTVYETVFLDDPSYGSICSGGRYDDLAGSYIGKHLPGVGISIGFSRLFDRIRLKGRLPASRKSPAQVLVTVFDDAQRFDALKTAAGFRKRGINAEVYHAAQKFQKQLGYAEKKEIPYVWFLPAEGKGHEVKNMATREQIAANPETWEPQK